MLAVEEPFQIHEAKRVVPDNLISEVPGSEHGVHQELEVVAGRRIAVEVNASGRLEHAAHFEKSDGHHDEVGLHARAVRETRRADHRVQRRVTIRNLAVPCLVHIVQRPGVLERRTGSFRPYRGGVVTV